jgi:argininosuccinate lyase
MRAAASGPLLAAVDIAEWLVERGMPCRDAHVLVAGLVRDSLERHVPIAELVQAHPALGTDAVALLEPGAALRRRTEPGGTGPEAVAVQMERFEERMEADADRIDARARPR